MYGGYIYILMLVPCIHRNIEIARLSYSDNRNRLKYHTPPITIYKR